MKDNDEYILRLRDAIANGTAVDSGAWMNWQHMDFADEYNTRWYRSKEKQEPTDEADTPWSVYIMNKKWTLEEEFNRHMLRFQQVTVISIYSLNYILTFQTALILWEAPFNEVKKDDKPEALRMEHFYFPLGLLVGGLLLSFLCFIAEIIFHRMVRLEEPRVTQSTPESEVEHNNDVEDIEDTKV